jgi:hypothetical protein
MDDGSGLGVGILSAVCAGGVALWASFKTQAATVASSAASDGLTGLAKQIAIEIGRLARGNKLENIVVPLGLSGSGKTTFVRYLTDDPDADPSKTTMKFSVYSKTFQIRKKDEFNSERVFETSVHIVDYRGQNLGDLFRGMYASSNEQNSAVRIGRINTLILIVDVFHPFDQGEPDEKHKQPMPDTGRIRDHIDQWNDGVLETVFSLLSKDRLQSVALFINKCDLITTEDGRTKARELFKPLYERLRRRTEFLGHDPTIIMGSLKTGEGLNTLKENLIRRAVYR